MHIIPVIDLLDGIVVHAKKGERASYQPIVSSLTQSNKPLDIVKAFMDIYPFSALYIADLQAIQKLSSNNRIHYKIIEDILVRFPTLKLWLDAGICDIDEANNWNMLNVQLVLGSESFNKIEDYNELTKQLTQPAVLSLDFMPQGYKGPPELLNDAKSWPQSVIVMTLNRVGSNSGIDDKTLQPIISNSSHHHIYAAGGIRNLNDLLKLKKMNSKGALIASALHSKQLSQADIFDISK